MNDYQITEKDIDSAMRYLKAHDPDNADRDYAIQLLESLQGIAHEAAKDGISLKDLEEFLKSDQ